MVSKEKDQDFFLFVWSGFFFFAEYPTSLLKSNDNMQDQTDGPVSSDLCLCTLSVKAIVYSCSSVSHKELKLVKIVPCNPHGNISLNS